MYFKKNCALTKVSSKYLQQKYLLYFIFFVGDVRKGSDFLKFRKEKRPLKGRFNILRANAYF
jgi:hypothetical protein